MDPGVASIVVAAIATTGTIVVALVNAFKDVDRAVRSAVAPKDDEIARLSKLLRDKGGDPDAP